MAGSRRRSGRDKRGHDLVLQPEQDRFVSLETSAEGGAGIDYITQQLAARHQKQAKELRPHVESFVRLLEEEALITSGSSSDGQGVPNASPAQDDSSTPYQEPRLVKYDTLEKLIVSGE